MKETILIVDDEKDLINGLKRTIYPELDCRILAASSGEEALEIVKIENVDLVLTDINMPGMNGMLLLEGIMAHDPSITVVIMTAFGTVELAVKALKNGAYDFVQKPFDFEQLLRLLKKGLERNSLLRENKRLQRQISEKEPLENMIGKSQRMQQVYTQIRTLAQTDIPVLITGETGTGKDMAARAIHSVSRRKDKEMVTINCPALPEGLLESELFGHKKGAFTGADSDKIGLFALAEGSTLFLDEIGDLPLSLQTKLLRVLQDHVIRPIGGKDNIKVNVRILAATNQALEEKIVTGDFRPDLYYRLNVAELVMPPLREIHEDIPLLANHFINKSACELGVEIKHFSSWVLNDLMSREWNGNIRELENTIRGWMATVPDPIIERYHLDDRDNSPATISLHQSYSGQYKELKEQIIEDFTREYVTRLLSEHQGNVSLSAKISGIQRQSLQKIINRYGIDVKKFR